MVNDKNDIILKGFNTDELRRVSECLAVLNPARCPNVDGTMRYIAQYARTHLQEPGYIETMGFCITGYHDHNDRLLFKVTLSSYGVKEFIDKTFEACKVLAASLKTYDAMHNMIEADYPGVTPQGNKITPSELGDLFGESMPMIALQVLAPEKARALNVDEVRWLLRAIKMLDRHEKAGEVLKKITPETVREAMVRLTPEEKAHILSAVQGGATEVTSTGNWSVEADGAVVCQNAAEYIAQHEFDIWCNAARDEKSKAYGQTVTLLRDDVVVRQKMHIIGNRKKDLAP